MCCVTQLFHYLPVSQPSRTNRQGAGTQNEDENNNEQILDCPAAGDTNSRSERIWALCKANAGYVFLSRGGRGWEGGGGGGGKDGHEGLHNEFLFSTFGYVMLDTEMTYHHFVNYRTEFVAWGRDYDICAQMVPMVSLLFSLWVTSPRAIELGGGGGGEGRNPYERVGMLIVPLSRRGSKSRLRVLNIRK